MSADPDPQTKTPEKKRGEKHYMRKTKKPLAILALIAMVLTMLPIQSVFAALPDYSKVTLNVSSVAVGQTATVSGTALGTDGKALAGAAVTMKDPSGTATPVNEITSAAGTFSFTYSFGTEGVYTLSVVGVTNPVKITSKYNLTMSVPNPMKIGDSVTFSGTLLKSDGTGVDENVYFVPTLLNADGSRTEVTADAVSIIPSNGAFSKTVTLTAAAVYDYGTLNAGVYTPYGTFSVNGLNTLTVKAAKASVTGNAVPAAGQAITVLDPTKTDGSLVATSQTLTYTITGVGMQNVNTLAGFDTDNSTSANGVYSKVVAKTTSTLDLSQVTFAGTGTVTVSVTYDPSSTPEITDYTGSTSFSVGAPGVFTANLTDINGAGASTGLTVGTNNNFTLNVYNQDGYGFRADPNATQQIKQINLSVTVPGDDTYTGTLTGNAQTPALYNADKSKSISVSSNVNVNVDSTDLVFSSVNPQQGGKVTVTLGALIGTNAVPVNAAATAAVTGYQVSYNFGTRSIGSAVTPVVTVLDANGYPVNNANVQVVGDAANMFAVQQPDGTFAANPSISSFTLDTTHPVNNGVYTFQTMQADNAGNVTVNVYDQSNNLMAVLPAGKVVGSSTLSVQSQTSTLVAGLAEDVVIVAKDAQGNLIKAADITGKTYALTVSNGASVAFTSLVDATDSSGNVIGFKVTGLMAPKVADLTVTLTSANKNNTGAANISVVAPKLTITPSDMLLTAGIGENVSVSAVDPRSNTAITGANTFSLADQDITATQITASSGGLSLNSATNVYSTTVYVNILNDQKADAVSLKLNGVPVATFTVKPVKGITNSNRLIIGQNNTVNFRVQDAHGNALAGAGYSIKINDQNTVGLTSWSYPVDGNGNVQFTINPSTSDRYDVNFIGPSVSVQIGTLYAVDKSSVVSRVAGANRIQTAIDMSQKGWAKSDTVVIATAYDFPDALAGSVLAASYDAPILLTGGSALDPAVSAEIARLHATKALVLGGTAVISDSVFSSLQNAGLTVTRYAGANRFETSASIARAVANKSGMNGKVFLANGLNFPDALAAASFAARSHTPILLTDGNSLDPSTQAVIKDLGISNITVLGSSAVVSDSLFSSLQGMSGITSVTRLGGEDRYATASQIFNTYANDEANYVFATGDNYPDALAGAAFAAHEGAALILTGTNSLPSGAGSFITGNPQMFVKAYILGGAPAVSDSVYSAIETGILQ